jgi:predicted nucleic acid-binding protein
VSIFIDTSAFLAVLNANDEEHHRAEILWEQLLLGREELICNNYVVLETFTLLQRRYGLKIAQEFHENILPILNVEWVTELDHHKGISTVLAFSRRKLSLVDCVSFEIMRRLGINRVFCFDTHFAAQGFECLPDEDGSA